MVILNTGRPVILETDWRRTYVNAVERFKQTAEVAGSRVTPRSRALVLEFLNAAAQGNVPSPQRVKRVGPARAYQILTSLWRLADYTGADLDKLSSADLQGFVAALEASHDRVVEGPFSECRAGNRPRTTPLSRSFQLTVKTCIIKFYRWVTGEVQGLPRLVAWIDLSVDTPEIDAISEQGIRDMILHASGVWQRAVIQVLFDSGVRLGELRNIRLDQVSMQQLTDVPGAPLCFSVRVTCSKTIPRTIILPMTDTTELLGAWLRVHPGRVTIGSHGKPSLAQPDMPLFPQTAAMIRRALQNAARGAGIERRVWPHRMRHSSATYWCNRLPYFQFCKRFGWTLISQMPRRYIDRAGIDDLNAAKVYFEERERRVVVSAVKQVVPATPSSPARWNEAAPTADRTIGMRLPLPEFHNAYIDGVPPVGDDTRRWHDEQGNNVQGASGAAKGSARKRSGWYAPGDEDDYR